MNAPLPSCILFDLDGTVLDSLPGIAFSVQEACRMVGLPEPKIDLRSLLGPPIRTILSRAVAADDPALMDRLEQAFRTSYDSKGWRKTSCFHGAQAALGMMKGGGHRLFVVSNKPRHISLKILEREGLLPLFEQIYTRDSRTPACTKQEMLRQFLSEYGVSSPDCLMVGDTMEDATAAAAAGIGFAYMTHGYGELAQSPSLPIAYKLDNFSQFLQLMTQEPVRDRQRHF
jgi:phosphoglycolate phosphatase